MKVMRKFTPKGNHVKNKDRQDLVAAKKISNRKVTSNLKKFGFIGHTVIPETLKFTQYNKVCMHLNLISLALRPFGYTFMLTYDREPAKYSKVTKFRFHNPLEHF